MHISSDRVHGPQDHAAVDFIHDPVKRIYCVSAGCIVAGHGRKWPTGGGSSVATKKSNMQKDKIGCVLTYRFCRLRYTAFRAR